MAGFWDALKAGASNFVHTNPQTGVGLSDNLTRLGAIFQDGGAGFQGIESNQVGQLDRSRARQAAMQGLNDLFAPKPAPYGGMAGPAMDGEAGPRAQATPGRIPSLTDPVTQRTLAQAASAGIDPSAYIELLKANKREFVNGQAVDPYGVNPGERVGVDLSNVNGFMVDQQDPKNAGRFMPQLGEGEQPLFDDRGQVVAVRNIDGSVRAMAEREAAKAAATSSAQAPFDLRTIEGPTGGKISGSRADILSMGPVVSQSPAEALQANSAAEARVGLPQAAATAQQTLTLLEQLRNHPGRKMATGATGMIPAIPGTPGKDFTTLLDQAKGQTFLTAYGSLKGAGAITEMEGKKAEQAIARLDRTQSEEGFLSAITDLEQVVKAGMQRAQQKAQPAAQRGPTRGVPSVGTVQQGYRFKGGNPASPSSWERAR